MKYVNAETVFPEWLLSELQQYVQGDWIYIPAIKGSRKAWGERSGSREALRRRNADIRKQYARGQSMEELSSVYGLAYDTIKKIVYSKT
ncbi:CD3324 family protein [Paenibacillus sp. KQZ6P-2]|uniref:CD3324 family protein n=1 Tax=Paenibacillus mangrovi TaxID=2931978 RepID=A0A9X1WTT0_9BACL|nr:CD3324 family protein [Paenibacillus mangrovi]MCJ8014546.1 CD3324 family protein [Paenibacillus mangrovi]